MIVILIGKCASGKDTLLKELTQNNAMNKIVSYTTRPKRVGEVNGIDYNFVSEQTFFELMQKGKFFQTRQYDTLDDTGTATVWYYGSELVNPESRVPYITIVDVQGARDYISAYGKENVFVVYVDASDDVRRRRAEVRGNFIESEWERRLQDDNDRFDLNNFRDIIDLTVLNEGDIRDSIFEIVYEYMNYTMSRYRIKNSEFGGILR